MLAFSHLTMVVGLSCASCSVVQCCAKHLAVPVAIIDFSRHTIKQTVDNKQQKHNSNVQRTARS